MSRFKSKISRAFFLLPLCFLTTNLSLEAADLGAGAGVNVGPVDVGAGIGAGPGGVGAGVGVGPVGVGVGIGGRGDQRGYGYGYPQETYYNDYNSGYNYPQDYQTQGYYTNQPGNNQGWRGYDQRDGRYRGNFPSNSNTGYYYSSPNNYYSNPNNTYPNEYYQQNGQYRHGVGAGAYIQAR